MVLGAMVWRPVRHTCRMPDGGVVGVHLHTEWHTESHASHLTRAIQRRSAPARHRVARGVYRVRCDRNWSLRRATHRRRPAYVPEGGTYMLLRRMRT